MHILVDAHSCQSDTNGCLLSGQYLKRTWVVSKLTRAYSHVPSRPLALADFPGSAACVDRIKYHATSDKETQTLLKSQSTLLRRRIWVVTALVQHSSVCLGVSTNDFGEGLCSGCDIPPSAAAMNGVPSVCGSTTCPPSVGGGPSEAATDTTETTRLHLDPARHAPLVTNKARSSGTFSAAQLALAVQAHVTKHCSADAHTWTREVLCNWLSKHYSALRPSNKLLCAHALPCLPSFPSQSLQTILHSPR